MSKKVTRAAIFLTALLAILPLNITADPASSLLLPYGPWEFCEANVYVPGCGSALVPAPGHEAYVIYVVPSSPNVTNFHWSLTGTRRVDGVTISLQGTFDRAAIAVETLAADPTAMAQPNYSFSPPIASGALLPGYVLTVIEREDIK